MDNCCGKLFQDLTSAHRYICKIMDYSHRFCGRAEDYIRYRPGYPPEIISTLENNHYLKPGDSIADIGSGTGFSARLFLESGYKVTGVEPNDEMRKASEFLLSDYADFLAVKGSASATTLPDECTNLIVCAQAFHWFDREQISPEWRRICKPDGHVLLIWNDRNLSSPFMKAYETIIDRHAVDFNEINHQLITDEIIGDWYSGGIAFKAAFPYTQQFDLQGLIGRTSSCSYMPDRGAEGYLEMESELTLLFNEFQQNGIVIFAYTTRIYIGKL
jgi:SAM-dependent methyltransferase